MPFDAVCRPIISAQLLVHIGSERGLAVEQCLRGTGIDLSAFADPQTEIVVGQ